MARLDRMVAAAEARGAAEKPSPLPHRRGSRRPSGKPTRTKPDLSRPGALTESLRARWALCSVCTLRVDVHICDPRHPAPRLPPGQVVQQHGLAHAWVTAHRERID
jgi:hypothetical protein